MTAEASRTDDNPRPPRTRNAAAAAGVAAAEGSPPKQASSHAVHKWGEVTGTMETGGGVGPDHVSGIPGKVTLTSKDGHTYTVKVGKNGNFSARVLVGTYRVVGYSPYITGRRGAEVPIKGWSPTVVTAGDTATVELGLFVP